MRPPVLPRDKGMKYKVKPITMNASKLAIYKRVDINGVSLAIIAFNYNIMYSI